MDLLILQPYKSKKNSLQKKKNKKHKRRNYYKNMKRMFLKEYFYTVAMLYGHL